MPKELHILWRACENTFIAVSGPICDRSLANALPISWDEAAGLYKRGHDTGVNASRMLDGYIKQLEGARK